MDQLNLFEDSGRIPGEIALLNDFSIPGFAYVPNFISERDHGRLLEAIDGSPWLNDLKRRVQHYGYRYDYKRRSLDRSMYLGDLPRWAFVVADRIFRMGFMKSFPDQVIVNEYLPGQGIADHVDCEPCFAEEIVSLSLGSCCIMDLKQRGNKANKRELVLQPKSLTVLSGESRYNWTHGIVGRYSDVICGQVVKRDRRVSLTFRKTVLAKGGD